MRLFLFILYVCFVNTVKAGKPEPVSKTWQLSGLNGVVIYAILDHEGVLYAGTGGSGIYISKDKGQNWTAANTGLTNLTVRSLYSKDRHVYAGTKDGIFLSRDNGASWTSYNNGMEANSSIYAILEINGKIFAGTKKGVYSSTDKGATWVLQTNGFAGQPHVYVLARQGSVIFAGTESNGMMKSADHGTTWTPASEGIPAGITISSCYIVNNEAIICGTDGAGGFVSNDNGRSWRPINSGLSAEKLFGLAASGNLLYAATVNSVFFSSDKGVSWTPIGMEGMPAKAFIYAILKQENRIFVGTELGVYSYKEN